MVDVILYFFIRTRYSDLSYTNLIFQRLVLSAIVLGVLDIISVYVDVPELHVDHNVAYFANALYYVAFSITGYLFFLYVNSYIYNRSERHVYSLVNNIILVMSSVVTVVLTMTRQVMVIEPDGTVTREAMHTIMYVAPVFFTFYALITIILNYKKFDLKVRVLFLITFVTAIVLVLWQTLFLPKFLLDGFIIMCCLLILMFALETPDYEKLSEATKKLENLQKDLEKEVEHQTAKAKERSRMIEELTLQTMMTLARTIDARDPNVNGHSLRVADMSQRLAKALGMSDEECRNIYYIGLLHDIGKIAVSDSILYNPDKLTTEEYELVKQHTLAGAKILSDITIMPEIATGARWHHERYDGHGYPDGLKGENIPLVARIICVADSYDAMVAQRRYGRRFTQEEAREEIKRGSGKQFDPEVAGKMVGIIDDDKDFKFNGDMYADSDIETWGR